MRKIIIAVVLLGAICIPAFSLDLETDCMGYTNTIDNFLGYIESNNLGAVMCAVQLGANVSGVSQNSNTSPMHVAVKANNIVMVRFLGEKGANVDIPDNMGNTPLHYAAMVNNLEIVKYLVSKNAKGNVFNGNRKSPCDLTKNSGIKQVLNFCKVTN